MSTTTHLGVAIVSAGTAALVTLLLRAAPVESTGSPKAVMPQNQVTAEALEELVARVDDLQRALDGQRLYSPSRPARESAARAENDREREDEDQTLEQLAARITTLERTLGRFSDSALGRILEPEPETSVLDLQAQVLDPTLTDEELLDLLGQLRHRSDEFGEDARSPAVVARMIAMAESSSDSDLRADVWRKLDGSTDSALRDPLLRSLQFDPSENVRSEAAESLGSFRSDPVVENALRHAAANDPSEDVREEALRSLGK